jgi:hypothetical protein
VSTLRHRLKQTEKAMRPLETRKSALEAELAADLDHRRMAELGAQLSGVLAELASLEERWLAIGEQLETHR